jgi:hypothetical protein
MRSAPTTSGIPSSQSFCIGSGESRRRESRAGRSQERTRAILHGLTSRISHLYAQLAACRDRNQLRSGHRRVVGPQAEFVGGGSGAWMRTPPPCYSGYRFSHRDGQRRDLDVRGRVALDPDKSGDSRHQAGSFTNGKVYRQSNRAQIVRLSHESAPP